MPKITASSVLLGLAVGPAVASATIGDLNLYWGQSGNEQLRAHCDVGGVTSVTISAMSGTPDESGVPLMSFGDHCPEGSLHIKSGKQTGLQLGCGSLKDDIAYCQSKGIKVLLSIGGAESSRSSLSLGSVDKGAEFADWLLNAFGPKQASYKGPRPFDRDGEAPTVLDGFDFDLDNIDSKAPWVSLVNRIRDRAPTMRLTAAPRCPASDRYEHMKDLVASCRFDALNLQFDNGACDVTDNSIAGVLQFGTWAGMLRSGKSADAKLNLVVSGDSASDLDYAAPGEIREVACAVNLMPSFGGIAVRDASRAAAHMIGAKSYLERIGEVVIGGCGDGESEYLKRGEEEEECEEEEGENNNTTSVPQAGVTTAPPAGITTSPGNANTVSTSAPPAGTTSAVPEDEDDDTCEDDDEGENNNTTAPPAGVTTASPAGATTTPPAGVTTVPEGSNSSAPPAGGSSSVPEGGATTSAPAPGATNDGDDDTCEDDDEPEGPTGPTGTAPTNVPSGPTVTAPTVTTPTGPSKSDGPDGPGGPDGPTGGQPSGPGPSGPDGPNRPQPTGSSGPGPHPGQMTTSTIFATQTFTITQCPPSVHNCPIGQVTTVTVPVSTTICPVTDIDTEPTAPPVQPSGPHQTGPLPSGATPLPDITTVTAPGGTNVPMTTSTVYATQTYTVTQCPPQVQNCPTGHVTTVVVPVSTTVCPVTDVPAPTGGSESGPAPSGGSGSGPSPSGGSGSSPSPSGGSGSGPSPSGGSGSGPSPSSGSGYEPVPTGGSGPGPSPSGGSGPGPSPSGGSGSEPVPTGSLPAIPTNIHPGSNSTTTRTGSSTPTMLSTLTLPNTGEPTGATTATPIPTGAGARTTVFAGAAAGLVAIAAAMLVL